MKGPPLSTFLFSGTRALFAGVLTTAVLLFFLLVSGDNQRQLVAIADAILAALKALDLRPSHVEGYPRQEWILLDYAGLVIHVMTPRMRGFYDLERLWGGAARAVLGA